MNKVTDITKTILLTMYAIVVIALIIGMFLTGDRLAFIVGLAFGAVFSTMKMILMEKNLKRSLSMDKTGAENYMRLNYLLRYFLTGVVLAVAALVPSIDLWGTVISVFALQASANLVNLFIHKKRKPFDTIENI